MMQDAICVEDKYYNYHRLVAATFYATVVS